MRLWSIDPTQLDRRALVACWREGLLARKVLLGQTRGYTRHPQLERFRDCDDHVSAIDTYLHGICDAADARGYSFDRSKLHTPCDEELRIEVTEGQLAHEWAHLSAKVRQRDPEWFVEHVEPAAARTHPMFTAVAGDIEPWERV